MLLAKPVRDRHGMLLLREDTRLSPSNIRMLKAWGAPEVWVQSDKEPERDLQPEHEVEMKELLEKELRNKFSDVSQDPVMAEIMRVAGKHLLKRYMGRKVR
jgi:hypothetical protein